MLSVIPQLWRPESHPLQMRSPVAPKSGPKPWFLSDKQSIGKWKACSLEWIDAVENEELWSQKYLNTFKYYEILKTLKQKEIQTKEARLLLLSGPLQRDRCFLLPNLFPRKLWLLVSVIMCHSTSQKVSKDTLKLKLPTFVCNTAVPLSVREQDAICRPTNPNCWTAFDSAPSFSCRLQSYQELHQSFHPDVLAVDICWLKRSQFDSKLNIDCWQRQSRNDHILNLHRPL